MCIRVCTCVWVWGCWYVSVVKVSYKFLVCRQDLLHSVRKDAAQLGLTIRPRLPVAATVAEPQVAQEEQPATADTQPSPADSPGQHTVYTPNELCYLRTKSGRLGVLQIHRAFQSNWACSLHCFCLGLACAPVLPIFPRFLRNMQVLDTGIRFEFSSCGRYAKESRPFTTGTPS